MALGAALGIPDFLNRLRAQLPPSLPPDPKAGLVPSGQPMFFLPERIKALQAKIAIAADIQTRWETFLRHVQDMVKGGGVRSMQFSLSLGLAWQITGNECYARKLRESLFDNLSAADWIGQDVGNQVLPWHSALDTASSVVSCVIAREALANYLTANERQNVTDGILRRGVLPILEDWILPGERIHALDSMGHNWWSVCISGAGIGALMLLGDDPRAEEWLGDIEDALSGFFDYQGMVLLNKPANFDPAGAFYESVHYAGYALESYLAFRVARINSIATPPPEIRALENITDFFVHTMYPASDGDLAINFGDSSLKPDVALTLRLVAITGYSPELTRWYLQRAGDNSLDPLSWLYLNDAYNPARNELPCSVSYPVTGWAMLRNSWDDNGTLLGVKCGFTWNHAHADAGSFILFHAGRPLLIDSGKCAYSRSEYLDYYCQSRAHNVVLFDGQGQSMEDFHSRGVKFPGQIHDLLDGAGLKYIYADATGPMAQWFKRNYRHWLWVDDVILVFDDVLAHENGRFDWLLHYAGEARLDGATVVLSNGPAQASLTMLYPDKPVIHHELGLAADQPDEKIGYLRFSSPAKTRVQKFMVAIIPRPNSELALVPNIEMLNEPDAIGVRISGRNQITEVYFNLQADGRRMHLNSNNVINGWETDAYLLAVTRPANGSSTDIKNFGRYFVAGCSYLRKEGQSVIESFSKVTAVIQTGNNTEILLHGQPLIKMAAIALEKPATLRVNRKLVSFSFEPERKAIRFQAT